MAISTFSFSSIHSHSFSKQIFWFWIRKIQLIIKNAKVELFSLQFLSFNNILPSLHSSQFILSFCLTYFQHFTITINFNQRLLRPPSSRNNRNYVYISDRAFSHQIRNAGNALWYQVSLHFESKKNRFSGNVDLARVQIMEIWSAGYSPKWHWS